MIVDLFIKNAARQVTEDAVQALFSGQNFRRGNTRVEDGVMYLHNNPIARMRSDGTVEITNAGWPTPTTRERLNGILEHLGMPRMYQQQGEQMLFDAPWDGSWTPIMSSELMDYRQTLIDQGVGDPGNIQSLIAHLTNVPQENWGAYTDYWLETGGELLQLPPSTTATEEPPPPQ